MSAAPRWGRSHPHARVRFPRVHESRDKAVGAVTAAKLGGSQRLCCFTGKQANPFLHFLAMHRGQSRAERRAPIQ